MDDTGVRESPGVDSDARALDDEVTVTLYLRASAPRAARRRQEVAHERAEALVEAGVAPDLAVREWNARVGVPVTGGQTDAVARYDEFADAAGEDVHLDPFFTERRGTGATDRIVVFPVICLALRRDGDLTGLYPCWNRGRHDSVEDGLRALETGDDAENLA